MNGFLAYILIADAIQALLLYVITKYDRTIEDHCDRAGVDVNLLVVVAILFGFIIIPFAFVKGISKVLGRAKDGE